MRVVVADVAVAVAVESLSRCAGAVTFPDLAAGDRCPPPSGMVPSLVISTCTSSPGLARSERRTGCAVARSTWASRARPNRVSTRCTVEGTRCSGNAMRAGPHRRARRTLLIRRSIRFGIRPGLVCGRDDRSAMPGSPSFR
nr:hypothetical protein GCM10020241_45240 [Streptoalloteichus tenebrarius]